MNTNSPFEIYRGSTIQVADVRIEVDERQCSVWDAVLTPLPRSIHDFQLLHNLFISRLPLPVQTEIKQYRNLFNIGEWTFFPGKTPFPKVLIRQGDAARVLKNRNWSDATIYNYLSPRNLYTVDHITCDGWGLTTGGSGTFFSWRELDEMRVQTDE